MKTENNKFFEELNKKIATKLFKYVLVEEDENIYCLKKTKDKEKIILPDYIGVTENTYKIVEYLKNKKNCEVFIGYTKIPDKGVVWNTKIKNNNNNVVYESGITDNMNLSVVLATLKFLENEKMLEKNRKEPDNLIYLGDKLNRK